MTKKTPQSIVFSIVIPVYNRSSVIGETLDSIKHQTYKNFEVILVDDCSSDSKQLQEVIQDYSDSFDLIYHRHTENLHGAAARNTGIKSAKGDYIAFLDSDDVWVSNKLELCAEFLVKNPDVDVLTSRILTTEHGKEIEVPLRPKPTNMSVADYLLFQFGSMQTSSLVVKANIAKDVLFDARLKRFQDYDFTIALDQAGYNFGFIDQALVVMTDNDQGNRIQNSTNLEPLEFWMAKVKPSISPRAYETFKVVRYVRCLLTNKKRIRALSELLRVRTLVYSRKNVWLKMFVASLIPFFIHDLILSMKRR